MKKKLIEVALPLDDINAASAREKSIRHGHPSTLHLWWARRPLATARAILFAQLVDDPNSPDANPEFIAACKALDPGKHTKTGDNPRHRLFDFICELIKWENSNNPKVLHQAKKLIDLCTDGQPPEVLDPFSGGCTIPLEAQRLGLKAHGSDLNPVAVLIGKASIEIPPKFSGSPPVNPHRSSLQGNYLGSQGLAEDIRFFGEVVKQEAEKRVGHLYPKAQLQDGTKANVIAWLWARTAKCPNPACGAEMQLVSSFEIAKKAGKETWVEPVIDRTVTPPTVRYTIKNQGTPPPAPKRGRGANFVCVCCDSAAPEKYIKTEGQAGRIGSQLMAVVVEGSSGRVYIPPSPDMERVALGLKPQWKPDQAMPKNPRWFSPPEYGLPLYSDLFSDRQLVIINTLIDIIMELQDKNIETSKIDLVDLKKIDQAYLNAICTYLIFALDKFLDYSSSMCSWHASGEKMRNTFGRQAIAMTWDYAEVNPFSNSTGNWMACVDWVWKAVYNLPASGFGQEVQADATQPYQIDKPLISTDPPYYDNIGYADLSDFFYIWMRKPLRKIYKELFGTLMVPKEDELVAIPTRHGGKVKAESFFLDGMTRAIGNMVQNGNQNFPTAIYYAFRQSESSDGGVSSTGWETFLEAVIRSGFSINGTWPVRSELANRMVSQNANALASSIVLVCRPRQENSPVTTRQDFLRELRRSLPEALEALQQANIAPVDMAQASIGPGIGIFSKYSRVIEADGSSMTVKTALQLINAALDEYLSEQDADLDSESRFAVSWFEQYAHNSAEYGVAETLATARGVSVQGVVETGILEAKAGKVRLLTREELPEDWDPQKDKHLTVWEATQHLIKSLEKGATKAAELMVKLGGTADAARDLAYRLYGICERKGWAQEAQAYNLLVINWADASQLKSEVQSKPTQSGLFG